MFFHNAPEKVAQKERKQDKVKQAIKSSLVKRGVLVPQTPVMTIEEAKAQARNDIAASDLLTLEGIRALKDNLDSDKYALLENLIAEMQELK